MCSLFKSIAQSRFPTYHLGWIVEREREGQSETCERDIYEYQEKGRGFV